MTGQQATTGADPTTGQRAAAGERPGADVDGLWSNAFVPTVELLARYAERTPDQVAHSSLTLDERGELVRRQLTFAEWRTATERLAGHVTGVAPRARLVAAIGAPEVYPEVAVGYVAAHACGAAYTVLPRGYGREQLKHLVSRLGIDVLLATERDAPDCAGLGVPVVGWHEAWTAGPGLDLREAAVPAPDQPGAVVFTSGSTGTPTAIAILHADLTFNSQGADPPRAGVTPHARYLHCSPPYVVDGHMMTLLPLVRGLEVATLATFTPSLWWTAVQRLAVTDMGLVPAVAAELVLEAKNARYDLGSVERIIVGSASLSRAVADELTRLFPAARLDVDYSLTESGQAGVNGPLDPAHPEIAGLPSVGSEVRIVGPDGTVLTTAGEQGEIQLRNRHAACRYYWIDGALGPRCANGDGWLSTGDLGYLDDAGRLGVVGRIKDVIAVGGLKVHAREVEEALEELDGIRRAGVIGVPSPLLGEEVVAVVETERDLDRTEVVAALRRRLPAWKVPTDVVVVDQLPGTATHKIDKPALVDMYRRMRELADLFAPSYSSSALRESLDLIGVEAGDGPDAPVVLTSLQAVQLRARLQERFGVAVPLELLLSRPTLTDLDRSIAESADPAAGRAEQWPDPAADRAEQSADPATDRAEPKEP